MKNKITRLLVFWALSAAGLFSLFILIGTLTIPQSGTLTNLFVRQRTWQLFLIALLIASANMVFFLPKVNLYFKLATHFIALGAILILAVYFTGYMERGNWVLLPVAYAIVYAVAAPVCAIVYTQKKRRQSADKDYRPHYGSK